MGKASRWFRAVLGLRKPDTTLSSSQQHDSTASRSKDKRRWSFVKSSREKGTCTAVYGQGDGSFLAEYNLERDPSRHAVAVAAATTAVAEAALAAAQAAAEVVRLTSSGRCINNPYAAYGFRGGGEDLELVLAVVKIQSVFRGYLARRALRALKALVKLQALIRGHIERKRTAEWLHRMQTLLRAQDRARAGRSLISESSHSIGKSYNFHHPGPATPEKFEHVIRARSGKHEQSSMLKRTGSKSSGRAVSDQDATHLSFNWSAHGLDGRIENQWLPFADDENNDRVLEIDTGKTGRRNLFHSSHHAFAPDQYSHSFDTVADSLSGEVQSLCPLKFPDEVEEAYCTAENSPQVLSASSRGGSGRRSPFTPAKSQGTRSFLSGYADYPNYMGNTESSRAKVRSLSAPRQRPQYERSSSIKRYSLFGFGEPRSISTQRSSALRASFTSNAYHGSGRLDRLGIPIGQLI